jgi:acyl carrier protein
MKEELRQLIKDLLDIEIVEDDTPLEIDSIDFLDLVIKIEDDYGIHIDLESVSKKISLDDLSRLVENLVKR